MLALAMSLTVAMAAHTRGISRAEATSGPTFTR
jgi:hypothetical protein